MVTQLGNRALLIGFLAATALAACGDEDRAGGGSGGAAGYGGFGGAGAFGGTGGDAGTGIGGTGGTAGTGIGGTGGDAGTGIGGTGGTGGDAGIGGTGGTGGTGGDGGIGGMAGMAGMGGAGGMAGIGGAGGAIMRGSEPTSQTASNDGPYGSASYTSGFANPVGGFSAATIYHPTSGDAPYAMVVICPGFTATQSSIAAWGPFLASHGIVTMTIDTGSTFDSVVLRSDQLIEALESLQAENSRTGSPLNGKLDMTRAGLMGWSMGGGGTWIASSKHPELRTAVSLAGHNSTAGGPTSSPNIQVPTFLCAGETDSGTLGGGMSQPMYTAIPESTPKMLYEVAGQGHNVCNTPTSNSRVTGRYILSWQKVFLEGDDRYRQFLLQMPSGTSDFRTNFQ